MENFNKNWLAILLIVLVFTSIGFLLGHLAASHHQNSFNHGMKDKMMFYNHDCSNMESISEEDIKVWVEKEGEDQDSCKKVIVKKVIK